ncbi:MAG: aerotolerance regulator BatA [Flavobacteriaceae bacterium]|nr:MAG: aerotolerance regulator BatA [Flavobacteriaceae bacterium]
MTSLEFKNPFWLLGLLFLVVWLLVRWIFKRNQNTTLELPNLSQFKEKTSLLEKMLPYLRYLKFLSLGFLFVAMARPREVDQSTGFNSDLGIDIILAVDVSPSMLAQDLLPDRISALKKVCQEFINARVTDRISLVAYSGESLTKVPLTIDKNVLNQEIEKLQAGEIIPGTAIGLGLATAINHLKNSKAKSKVILLMTDGENNLHQVPPLEAAKAAKELGIKVYTIGIGTNGYAITPTLDVLGNTVFSNQKVAIDEDLLKGIASETGGRYFRATDNDSLDEVYREIDRLEKSEIKSLNLYNYTELYRWFLIPGLLLLLMDFVFKYLLIKQLD